MSRRVHSRYQRQLLDTDSGATWQGWSGRVLRLAADYGARRDALEPLLRLVLDAAALAVLLHRRSSGPGGFGGAAAVQR